MGQPQFVQVKAVNFEIFNDAITFASIGPDNIRGGTYSIRVTNPPGERYSMVMAGHEPRSYRLTSTQLVEAINEWLDKNEGM